MGVASRLIACLLFAVSAAAAPRGPAVQANTLGMRRYQAGQLARAAENFRDAIAADPSYTLAHYNLACVASRLRDVKTALEELSWLAASKDPIARQKLAKASRDPDLDFVSALPA